VSRDAPLDEIEVGLLGTLGRRSRRRLAERLTVHAVRAGEWLFRAGEPGDCLFVVRSGRLDVIGEGDEGVLRRIGRGEIVGELALLTGSPRSASVRAHRDSELLAVARADFEDLLRHDDDFAMGLLRGLGERLKVSVAREDQAGQADRVIALAGAPDPRMVADLAAALADGERVACLDAGGAGAEAGWGPALERAEREHDRVLLVVGAPGPWSAFCLRSADRVVLFARPDEPVARDPALRHCDLAWVARAGDGALLAPWLAALEPARRHLLRVGRLDDGIHRLARRLAGRAVGLVLSGGGARALCHIGVLDALADAGVVVDRVGGCSMGAFVGALFALGLTPDEIAARCEEELVRRRPFNDYTVPRVALIRSRKARRMLERVFAGRRIEELERDYFCVSADLVAAEPVVHRWGPLWEAIGASMSLPGLVPPVVAGDRLLVDGGVLDNFPVEVMAAGAEGPIVAVDAMGRSPLGGAGGPPPLLETLARATVLSSWQAASVSRALADVLVVPDPGPVGMLAFERVDELRRAGREAAASSLAAWSSAPSAAPA
jgi:predicted acylesterase/phospholipase RssA/CRP-like cAMP-binding protein